MNLVTRIRISSVPTLRVSVLHLLIVPDLLKFKRQEKTWSYGQLKKKSNKEFDDINANVLSDFQDTALVMSWELWV